MKKLQDARRAYVEQLAFIRQFKKDDEGGLIILTLLLLISMLVVGGMAVDFMRYESERTKLQSVSDRAVLAAANLNQNLGPAEIVRDFFAVEGFPNAITTNLDTSSSTFDRNSGSSVITLESQVEVNTFYLRLAGIDTLTAPASSSAIQGTGNVEISLVLDISGSMRRSMTGTKYLLNPDGSYERYDEDDYVTDPTLDPELLGQIKTEDDYDADRMFFLRQAANKFIFDMLQESYKDRVSINLIAYSQHVSLGDELYSALKTTPDSMSADGLFGSSFGEYSIDGGYSEPFKFAYEDAAGDEVIYLDHALEELSTTEPGGSWRYKDDISKALPDDQQPRLRGFDEFPLDVSWAGGEEVFTNPSRCVTFTDEEYETLTFDVDRVYQQVEYVDFYTSDEAFNPAYSPCPAQDFQGIIPMSQDIEELQSAINQYIPTLNTSIHRGMKWGTALLDPSMRPIIEDLETVDPVFRGSRPADYRDGVTSKYIVIMTDGQTVSSREILPDHYDEYEERVALKDKSLYWWGFNDGNSATDYWNMSQSIGNVSDATATAGPTVASLNGKLASLCTLAASNVNEVYTISMGVTNTTMTNCASDDANAFQSTITNEPGQPGLGDIFDKISNQITALRLSQ